MPSSRNEAIIAVAGARKTQTVIERALADESRRVLITTYTNENLRQIASRIEQAVGFIPPHIQLAGWFSFLLRDGVRPYQSHMFQRAGLVGGLNFIGQKSRYVKGGTRAYFLDSNNDVYRDQVSDLVCKTHEKSGGLVVDRLERLYDHIFIDEVQDLVGYDLDLLDLLFASRVDVTVVGDPRQHTFATNTAAKNKRFRGAGFTEWLDARDAVCVREDRTESSRCHQEICDFASEIFPDLPALQGHSETSKHDGIHTVNRFDVLEYAEEHKPQVLRYDKRANTQGLGGMNIGVSKGSTFERVLIFPTKPMLKFLETRDPSVLKAPESLYVAVTRARQSVAFVI